MTWLTKAENSEADYLLRRADLGTFCPMKLSVRGRVDLGTFLPIKLLVRRRVDLGTFSPIKLSVRQRVDLGTFFSDKNYVSFFSLYYFYIGWNSVCYFSIDKIALNSFCYA